MIAADFRTLVPVAAGELQQIAIERRAKVQEFHYNGVAPRGTSWRRARVRVFQFARWPVFAFESEEVRPER